MNLFSLVLNNGMLIKVTISFGKVLRNLVIADTKHYQITPFVCTEIRREFTSQYNL